MKKIALIILIVKVSFLNILFCNQHSITIHETDYINCLHESAIDPTYRTNLGALSTVIYDGNRLIMGNDKPIKGDNMSAVLSIDYPSSDALHKSPVNYLTHELFKSTVKFEAGTTTLDKKYAILSTGLSTLIPCTQTKEKYYARMLFFPTEEPHLVHVVGFDHSLENEIPNSLSIRHKIGKVIDPINFPDGPAYLNIEGLTIIPGNKLLFGIRQYGSDYSNFKYCFKIISVSFSIENHQLTLGDDFELIYEADLKKFFEHSTDKDTASMAGISDMTYDPDHDRLIILTATEKGISNQIEDLNTFVWILPIQDLYAKKDLKMAKSIRIKSSTTLNTTHSFVHARENYLPHKLEGITKIGKDLFFLVADDDYVFGTSPKSHEYDPLHAYYRLYQYSQRQAHQSAYMIIEIPG